MSYTSAIMTSGRATKIVTSTTTQTFAAKLTETSSSLQLPSATASGKSRTSLSQMGANPSLSTTSAPSQVTSQQQSISSAAVTTIPSPKHHRPLPAASAPPSIPGQYQMTPGKAPFSSAMVPGPNPVSSPPSQVPSSAASSASSGVSSSGQGRSNTPLNQQLEQQQTQQQQQLPSQLHPQQQQQSMPLSTNTPLEYSLFNDTFTKVILIMLIQ